jgi:hypothetical protein
VGNYNDFRIRVRRTNSSNRRVCDVDWLGLRATLEIDARNEPWGDSSFIGLPADIDDGQIRDIIITDEAAKDHLNYAGQDLLESLAEMCGFSSGDAQTFAQEVAAYRSADSFDSVEELMQLGSMTNALFEQIRDEVTVYSWANSTTTRPAGQRAPININTADFRMLMAMYRTIIGDIKATLLTTFTIVRRDNSPFTHLGSTYSFHNGNRSSLAYFLDRQFYLTNQEKLALLEMADGSYYNIGLTGSWTGGQQAATEFCYYSDAYFITAEGESRGMMRRVSATFGYQYDQTNFAPGTVGTFNLPRSVEETNPAGYWREDR